MSDIILGSSLTFSAQGGRGKEKILKPAEKIGRRSEGAAEGGAWGEGIFARLPAARSAAWGGAGWRAERAS